MVLDPEILVARLEPFVGAWRIETSLPEAQPGRATFEWMPGQRFLVERWGFPPTAPEGVEAVDGGGIPVGIAIIGPDPDGEGFLQHYFDSRGVARVYRMSLADGVWKLWRNSPDFSPADFSQRFEGSFNEDGLTIECRWEISHDGERWEHDFDLTYTKLS